MQLIRKNPVLALLGLVFATLFVGLIFTQLGDSIVPIVEQTSTPESSTGNFTDDQSVQFAILIFLVVGSVVGMGVSLYIISWVLSREVIKAQEQPETPFELLSFSTETEENTLGKALTDNALPLVIALGGGLTAVALLILFLV